MSTIRADSVAPSVGGTSRNLPRGVAAAWMNLNGVGTIAVRDSVNTSSATDNGTGDYSENLTSAMSSANYAAIATAKAPAGGGPPDDNQRGTVSEQRPGTSPTASAFRLVLYSFRLTSLLDVDIVSTNVLGSLA